MADDLQETTTPPHEAHAATAGIFFLWEQLRKPPAGPRLAAGWWYLGAGAVELLLVSAYLYQPFDLRVFFSEASAVQPWDGEQASFWITCSRIRP